MNETLNWLIKETELLGNDILALAEDIKTYKTKIHSCRTLQTKNGEDHEQEIIEAEKNLALAEKDYAELKQIRHHYNNCIEAFKLFAIIKKNMRDTSMPNWYIFWTNEKVMKELTKIHKETIYGKNYKDTF